MYNYCSKFKSVNCTLVCHMHAFVYSHLKVIKPCMQFQTEACSSVSVCACSCVYEQSCALKCYTRGAGSPLACLVNGRNTTLHCGAEEIRMLLLLSCCTDVCIVRTYVSCMHKTMHVHVCCMCVVCVCGVCACVCGVCAHSTTLHATPLWWMYS